MKGNERNPSTELLDMILWFGMLQMFPAVSFAFAYWYVKADASLFHSESTFAELREVNHSAMEDGGLAEHCQKQIEG